MWTDSGGVEFIESVLCRSIDDTIVWKNLKFYDKYGKTFKIKKLNKERNKTNNSIIKTTKKLVVFACLTRPVGGG